MLYICRMETIKKCFVCSTEKPLNDFYKHKKMADGHLGKCKECTKSQSDARDKMLRKDSEYLAKEKKRGREKYHRLYSDGRHYPNAEDKKRYVTKYKEKYPEKQLAKQLSQHLFKMNKENHLHHWSYNKEHSKDVIELTRTEHSKLHRYLIYDQERMMYRRIDSNILLDTRELHENYIKEIENKD